MPAPTPPPDWITDFETETLDNRKTAPNGMLLPGLHPEHRIVPNLPICHGCSHTRHPAGKCVGTLGLGPWGPIGNVRGCDCRRDHPT